MYNMDPDQLPKRPLVTSLAAANREFDAWLHENRLDAILDGDGLPWRLEVAVTQDDDPSDPYELRWTVRLTFKTEADAPTFVQTGTLDPGKDGRLLGLLGDAKVPMQMKPTVLKASGEEDARRQFLDTVPRLKEKLAQGSLTTVKRQLIGRWVDEHSRFDRRG